MQPNFTSEIYRYRSLLKAIEVFTDRFSIDQIADYAFEIAIEILTLRATALFFAEGDRFVLRRERLYGIAHYSIDTTKNLKHLPTWHAGVLRSDFSAQFPPEMVQLFRICLIIPLVIHDSLIGFIIADGKVIGELDEEDYLLSENLLRLIKASLENSKHNADLLETNEILDNRIYHLMAINAYSKSLLAETALSRLYAAAVDAFGELSRSQITSLGILDELTGRIQVLGYRDVLTYDRKYAEFDIVKNGMPTADRIVLDVEKDRDLLARLFVNPQDFKLFQAKYVILFMKERLCGFVTLSEPTLSAQDSSFFEVIEALASATFIAIENARRFEQISMERNRAQAKLNALTSLNRLVRNIAQCLDQDELFSLALQSLRLSIGLEKGFIFIAQPAGPVFHKMVGFSEDFAIDEDMITRMSTVQDRGLYDYTTDGARQWFAGASMEMQDANCLVIVPLRLNRRLVLEFGATPGDEFVSRPLAYLCAVKVENGLTEEKSLVIDTFVQSMGPALQQIISLEWIREHYILDTRAAFLQHMSQRLAAKTAYGLNFWLYFAKIDVRPFEVPTVAFAQSESFVLGSYALVVADEPLEDRNLTLLPTPASLEDVLSLHFA